MKKKIILFGIILISFLLLLITTLYLINKISYLVFYSIIISFLITTFGFSLGALAIKLGIKKSQKTFLIFIFGGMMVRQILMAAMVFVSFKFLEINQNSFIFSIFFFYILYLFIEIFYLNLGNK